MCTEDNIQFDNNVNETAKKVKPSKSEKMAKQFKQLLPYICNFLVVLVIFGPVCYVISKRNYHDKRQFVNLKVNFDLNSVKITSGKIPWRPIDSKTVALEGNGTMICVLQPALFSIDVMLNLDNKRNNDSVAVSVCILNSRDRNGNQSIPEVLSEHMQRSVTVSANLNLQKGDTVWGSVIGLNLVFQRPDVNSMSIAYDT
ncbi:unnamed protein product [Mytilus edulis]|uniref:Uncharacterized protein n=1 Tax=Mytilus edulis TaxID=6550 RepID=A0A8S3QB54_MYTED|nr:unnamed protein product [Mytilus edulis]